MTEKIRFRLDDHVSYPLVMPTIQIQRPTPIRPNFQHPPSKIQPDLIRPNMSLPVALLPFIRDDTDLVAQHQIEKRQNRRAHALRAQLVVLQKLEPRFFSLCVTAAGYLIFALEQAERVVDVKKCVVEELFGEQKFGVLIVEKHGARENSQRVYWWDVEKSTAGAFVSKGVVLGGS